MARRLKDDSWIHPVEHLVVTLVVGRPVVDEVERRGGGDPLASDQLSPSHEAENGLHRFRGEEIG